GPAKSVAARRIKLCAMISEGEEVSFEKTLKPGAGGREQCFGLVEFTLRCQCVGEAPMYFRIADCDHRSKQRFRVTEATLRGVNLGQMHPRLGVTRKDINGFTIPR